jgi:hypothetical protein
VPRSKVPATVRSLCTTTSPPTITLPVLVPLPTVIVALAWTSNLLVASTPRPAHICRNFLCHVIPYTILKFGSQRIYDSTPRSRVAPAKLACLLSICVCIALDTPSRYPTSVAVTADTATLPDASDTRALDTVRFSVSIVVAPPVIVACLLLSCVCIALDTPSRYPTSVAVTADTATLPEPSDTRALDTVRFSVSIVVAPPVIVACLLLSCVCTELVASRYPRTVEVIVEAATLPAPVR